MRRPPLLPLVGSMVVGALSLLLALAPGQGPDPASATHVQTAGAIDFVRIDADPATAGIQPCISVTASATITIDLIVDAINAADSNNFASGGNVGFNFTTGDFTSPAIDFVPGAIDDIGGLTPLPLGSITSKVAGKTHVARAYFNFGAVAPGLVGQVIAARATLTAGAGTGLKTIGVTKTTPLDGGFDFFLGSNPQVQPTNPGSAIIAVGVDCPAITNNPPTATNDSATTAEDTAKVISVLANDSDPDFDTLTITAVSDPAHGAAVISGGGATITYTPDAGFSGADSFTYTISDGRGGADTATVSITVTAAAPTTSPTPTVAGVVGAPTPTPTTSALPATGQMPGDGGSNRTMIFVTLGVVAAALGTAAAAWWRLRRQGHVRQG